MREFPALPRNTFKSLPGLLADSLPDKWGNAIIDAWLARQGRSAESFNPVERRCYIGRRGMSALEFESALLGPRTHAKEVDIAVLVDLSGRILGARESLQGELLGEDDREAMENILCVGTSAGGARAKAILVWDPQSGAFRSGQLPASAGFQYWLLKFDGVGNNRDRELADPAGFSGIGYAYALIAQAEGIHMSHCRLREEGGRAHFMTRRFDRTLEGAQIGHALPVRTRPLRFHQAGAGSCE